MAGKWSNSTNGNLRYSVNRQNQSGVYLGPTLGLSSPKNNRRGCLCIGEDRYDVACCGGHLVEQGIGSIESPYPNRGGFNTGYDDGYN
jgi:hypothetical protein